MSIKTLPKPVTLGWYTPHAPVTEDGTLVHPVTGEVYKPAVRVKQEFRDECDINNIIKAFTLTGQITHISAKAKSGVFMDLPDDIDFQTSMNVVTKAGEAFDALPAKIRDRFHNSPAEFLEFVADPSNADELVKLGIREPPPRKPAEPATGTGGAGGPPPAPPAAAASAEPPGGSNTPS